MQGVGTDAGEDGGVPGDALPFPQRLVGGHALGRPLRAAHDCVQESLNALHLLLACALHATNSSGGYTDILSRDFRALYRPAPDPFRF